MTTECLKEPLTVMRLDSDSGTLDLRNSMTEDQQTLNTSYDGFGGDGCCRRFGGGGLERQPPERKPTKFAFWSSPCTIRKQLMWRGSSSDTLSNNSNKNIQNLDNGVEKLFHNFPELACAIFQSAEDFCEGGSRGDFG